MFDTIKKIFKKKPKDKRVYKKLKDHGTDISYENEIKILDEVKKLAVDATPKLKKAKETKATKSSMVSGQ
jgi:hypothetical protein